MQAVARRIGAEEFLTHRDELLRVAARALRSHDDAEDVVQEVMVQALRRPPVDVRDLSAWLRRATLRTAIRHREDSGRRRDRERAAAPFDETPSFVGRLAHRAALVELCRVVNGLEDPHRSALRLRYLEDMEYDEVAQRLGVTEDAARRRVKRGLDRLRERIESRRVGFLSLFLALLFGRPRRASFALTAGAVAVAVALVVSLSGSAPWRVDASAAPGARPLDALARRGEPLAPSPSVAGRAAAPAPAPAVPEARDARRAPRSAALPLAPLRVVGRVLAHEASDGTPYVTASTPLADARIHVSAASLDDDLTRDGDETRASVATSASDGGFELSNASPRQWIWAEADGWEPTYRYRLDSLPVDANGAVRIELRFNTTTTNERVRVVSESGAPIEDARVVLGRSSVPYWGSQGALQWRRIQRIARSDADGLASVDVASLSAEVLIVADGYAPLVARLDALAADADVVDDATRAGRVARLTSGDAARGTVRDASGAPASGAVVTLVCDSLRAFGAEYAEHRTVTDTSGGFRFDHVPAGAFDLVASLPLAPGAASARARGELVAEAGCTLDLELTEAASVHGRVLGDGRAGTAGTTGARCVLAVGSSFAEHRAWTSVDETGAFRFDGLDDGPCAFLLYPSDVDRAQPPIALARAVGVHRGEEVELVASTARSTIRGALRTAPGARVVLRRTDSPFESLELALDRAGGFASPFVPEGEYEVSAFVPGAGERVVARVELAADEDHDLGELPALELASLRVRFLREDDTPIHGWSLEAVGGAACSIRRHADPSFVLRDVEETDDGFLVEGVLPGDYVLSVKRISTESTSLRVSLASGERDEVLVPLSRGFATQLVVRAPRDVLPGETIDLVWTDGSGMPRTIRVGHALRGGGETLFQIAWHFAREDFFLEGSTSGGLSGQRLVLADEVGADAPILLDLN